MESNIKTYHLAHAFNQYALTKKHSYSSALRSPYIIREEQDSKGLLPELRQENMFNVNESTRSRKLDL